MGDDRLVVEDVQRFLHISLVLLLFLLCELHRCTLEAIRVFRLVSEQSPHDLLEYLVHEQNVLGLRLENHFVYLLEDGLDPVVQDRLERVLWTWVSRLLELVVEDLDADGHEIVDDPTIISDGLKSTENNYEEVAVLVVQNVLLNDVVILVLHFHDTEIGFVLLDECLRMIIEEVDFVPDPRAEPFDEVARMGLQECEEQLVDLLVQDQRFRDLHFDVF